MSDDRCVMGIDPGLSGAIAFLFTRDPHRVAVEDMPVVDGNVSAPILAQTIKKYAPSYAVIEHVNAMPKQGRIVDLQLRQGIRSGHRRWWRTQHPIALRDRLEVEAAVCAVRRQGRSASHGA